jgi:hypothetical protein
LQVASQLMFNNVTNTSVSSSGYTLGMTDLNVAGVGTGGGFGPRAAVLATQYRYWRLKRLKVTVMMNFGGVSELSVAPIGVVLGVAYSPGYVPGYTPPASFTDLTSFPAKRMSNGFQKMVMTVPRHVINKTLYPRFRTTVTGTPSYEEVICGQLYYLVNLSGTPAATVNCWSLLEGVLEFSDPCDTGMSMGHPDLSLDFKGVSSEDDEKGFVKLVKSSDVPRQFP